MFRWMMICAASAGLALLPAGCGGDDADQVDEAVDLLSNPVTLAAEAAVAPTCEEHRRPGDPMGAMRAFIGQGVPADLGTNLYVLPQHIRGPHLGGCCATGDAACERVRYFTIPVIVDKPGSPQQLTLLYMLEEDLLFYLPQIQTYHFWWVLARHPELPHARCDNVPEQLKCVEGMIDEVFPVAIDP